MLKDLKIPNERVPEYTQEERQRMQRAFGYTYESLKDSILPMAKNGIEGTAAMGTDTPLAALSGNREPLFNYFKQLFAQVTNPPAENLQNGNSMESNARRSAIAAIFFNKRPYVLMLISSHRFTF